MYINIQYTHIYNKNVCKDRLEDFLSFWYNFDLSEARAEEKNLKENFRLFEVVLNVICFFATASISLNIYYRHSKNKFLNTTFSVSLAHTYIYVQYYCD